MEARTLVVFIGLAWCACVNSSRDVEEFYDDLGPSAVAGFSHTKGDSVVRLDSRSTLGESSEVGVSKKDSGESWSSRETRRCGCAREMLRRGVELEDMRLLQESFSQDDELVFLQAGKGLDVVKAAAAFSGYEWTHGNKQDSSEEKISSTSLDAATKSMMSDNDGAGLTAKSSISDIVKRAETHEAAQTSSAPEATKPTPSTFGIGETLDAAEKEDQKDAEKDAVLDQKEPEQCIKFCKDLANKATSRVEHLIGERRQKELKGEEQEEKQEEDKDKKKLKAKKELLDDQRAELLKKKVDAAKSKDQSVKERLSDSKENLANAEKSSVISTEQLNEAARKLVKKLNELRGTVHTQNKERIHAEKAEAAKKAKQAAALSKEKQRAADIKNQRDRLKNQMLDDKKKLASQEAEVEKGSDQKEKAEADQSQAAKAAVTAEEEKAKLDAKAQFTKQDAQQVADTVKNDAEVGEQEERNAREEKRKADGEQTRARQDQQKINQDTQELTEEEAEAAKQIEKDEQEVAKDKSKTESLDAKSKREGGKQDDMDKAAEAKHKASCKDQAKLSAAQLAQAKAKEAGEKAAEKAKEVEAQQAKIKEDQELEALAKGSAEDKKKALTDAKARLASLTAEVTSLQKTKDAEAAKMAEAKDSQTKASQAVSTASQQLSQTQKAFALALKRKDEGAIGSMRTKLNKAQEDHNSAKSDVTKADADIKKIVVAAALLSTKLSTAQQNQKSAQLKRGRLMKALGVADQKLLNTEKKVSGEQKKTSELEEAEGQDQKNQIAASKKADCADKDELKKKQDDREEAKDQKEADKLQDKKAEVDAQEAEAGAQQKADGEKVSGEKAALAKKAAADKANIKDEKIDAKALVQQAKNGLEQARDKAQRLKEDAKDDKADLKAKQQAAKNAAGNAASDKQNAAEMLKALQQKKADAEAMETKVKALKVKEVADKAALEKATLFEQEKTRKLDKVRDLEQRNSGLKTAQKEASQAGINYKLQQKAATAADGSESKAKAHLKDSHEKLKAAQEATTNANSHLTNVQKSRAAAIKANKEAGEAAVKAVKEGNRGTVDKAKASVQAKLYAARYVSAKAAVARADAQHKESKFKMAQATEARKKTEALTKTAETEADKARDYQTKVNQKVKDLKEKLRQTTQKLKDQTEKSKKAKGTVAEQRELSANLEKEIENIDGEAEHLEEQSAEAKKSMNAAKVKKDIKLTKKFRDVFKGLEVKLENNAEKSDVAAQKQKAASKKSDQEEAIAKQTDAGIVTLNKESAELVTTEGKSALEAKVAASKVVQAEKAVKEQQAAHKTALAKHEVDKTRTRKTEALLEKEQGVENTNFKAHKDATSDVTTATKLIKEQKELKVQEDQKVVSKKAEIIKLTNSEETSIAKAKAAEVKEKMTGAAKRQSQKSAAQYGDVKKAAGQEEARALLLHIRSKETVEKKTTSFKAAHESVAKDKAAAAERVNKVKLNAVNLKDLNLRAAKKQQAIEVKLQALKLVVKKAQVEEDNKNAVVAAARKEARDQVETKIAYQEKKKAVEQKAYFHEVKSIQLQRKLQYDHAVSTAKQIGAQVQHYEQRIAQLITKLADATNAHQKLLHENDIQSLKLELTKEKSAFSAARDKIELVREEQKRAQKAMDAAIKSCPECAEFEAGARAKTAIAFAKGKAFERAKALMAQDAAKELAKSLVVEVNNPAAAEEIVGEPFR